MAIGDAAKPVIGSVNATAAPLIPGTESILTAALHAEQVRAGVSKSEIARRLKIGRTSGRRILADYHLCSRVPT